jgi:serine-type D-Ala-D-Ala carboxypeptidase (penicillin-binding protein 5/6)
VRGLLLAALLVVLAAFAPPARAADPPPPPSVSAPSAIVVETSTGAVPFARRPDQRRSIASVTKLMTALLTLEQERLSQRITAVRYRPGPAESLMGLQAGERLTVADLLRGLLLASANDAAATLAQGVAGSRARFVREMNTRARALGLAHTRFADPVGLEARSQSSARDLVTLTLQLRRSSFFRRTVDRAGATLRTGVRARTLANRNTLVRQYPWISGVKTGHTNRAGYVLVGSATRNGVTLVSVVLGTASEAARNADTLALLRYGFRRYTRATPVRRGRVLATAPIRFRRGAELRLVAGRTVRRVVERGTRLRTRVVSAPSEVEGPIRKGQRMGRAEVLAGGRSVASFSLVAASSVPEAGVAQRTKDWMTRPLAFALVVLAVGGSVGLLLRRRSRTRPPRPRRAGGSNSEVEAA